MEEGKFRSDLYYRLNIFPIELSPLRQRPVDIVPLAESFLETYAAARGIEAPELSVEVQKALLGYAYPGNARELKNLMERAAILSRGKGISCEHLNFSSPGSSDTPGDSIQRNGQSEKSSVLAALDSAKWNRKEAAESLGISYAQLRYKIQKFKLA